MLYHVMCLSGVSRWCPFYRLLLSPVGANFLPACQERTTSPHWLLQSKAWTRRKQMLRLLLAHPRVNASYVNEDGATLWFYAMHGLDESSLSDLLELKHQLPSLNHQARFAAQHPGTVARVHDALDHHAFVFCRLQLQLNVVQARHGGWRGSQVPLILPPNYTAGCKWRHRPA